MAVFKSKHPGWLGKTSRPVADFHNYYYFEVLADFLRGPAGTFDIDQDDGGDIVPEHLALLRENLLAAQRRFSALPAAWEHVFDTFSLDPRTKEHQPIQIRRPIDNGILLPLIESLLSASEQAERDGEFLIFIGD
ncbi:MAG: hypothetical protein ABJF10_23385 [Chthoniobacter sp.]|uniref:hypothetical protein n=1 Tax=Chthoniobacter sp. TaxID=2510640 RepID=UPI0032A38A42